MLGRRAFLHWAAHSSYVASVASYRYIATAQVAARWHISTALMTISAAALAVDTDIIGLTIDSISTACDQYHVAI